MSTWNELEAKRKQGIQTKTTTSVWDELEAKRLYSGLDNDIQSLNTSLSDAFLGEWRDAATMKSYASNLSSTLDKVKGYKSYLDTYYSNDAEKQNLSQTLADIESYYTDATDTLNYFTNYYGQHSNADTFNKQKAHDQQLATQLAEFQKLSDSADFSSKSQIDKATAFNIFNSDSYQKATTREQQLYDSIVNNIDIGAIAAGYSTTQMNEDEKALYRYITQTQGVSKAAEYVDLINDTLNYRQGEEMTNSWVGKNIPILLSIASGVDSNIEGITNAFNSVLNPNTERSTSAMQYAGGIIGQREAEEDAIRGTFVQIGQGIGQMIPQMFVSVATGGTSGAAGASEVLSKILSMATLGTSVYGNTYNQALQAGNTGATAYGYGLANAAVELFAESFADGLKLIKAPSWGKAITSKLSSGKMKVLTDAISNAAQKPTIRSILDAFGEGAEEVFSSAISPILESFFLGEDLEAASIEQMLYDGLLGTLTAGVMNAPSTATNIYNNFRSNRYYSGLNREIQDKDFDKVRDAAIQMNPETKSYQTASKWKKRSSDSISKRQKKDFLRNFESENPETAKELYERAVIASKAKGEREAKTRNATEAVKNSTFDMNNYAVSSDNKTYRNDGSEVDFSDFTAKIEIDTNGNATFTSKSGESISTSDSTLPSYVVDAIGQAVARTIPKEAYSTFFKHLPKGGDASAYAVAFSELYNMGKGAEGLSIAQKSRFEGVNLSDMAKGAIYLAGIETRKSSDEAFKDSLEKAKKVATKDGKFSFKDGKFDDSEIRGMRLSQEQKTAKRIAQLFTKFGLNIHFYASSTSERATGKRANGYFAPETGTIHLDINAGSNEKVIGSGIFWTISHEVTHMIKAASPEHFFVLQEYVFDSLFDDNEVRDLAIEQEQNRHAEAHPNEKKMSRETAIEEIVARACENIFKDSKALTNLLTEGEEASPGFAKTIVDNLKKFVQKFVDFFKSLSDDFKSTSAEAKYFDKHTDKYQELMKMWNEGLSAALENAKVVYGTESGINYKASEIVNRSDEKTLKYSDRAFSEQVDAVLNGADTTNSHLKVMNTPKLLQEAGFPDLPILLTAKHLKKITSSESINSHNHGLDIDIVKNLPKYISDPVIIADSFTRSDSVVVVTEAVDSEDRPVIAAIMLDGTGRLDGTHINANILTSTYGKKNFQSFLNRIAESNSIIYWNKKKSQELSVSPGLQLPNAITSLNSDIIIRKSKAFVNAFSETSQKNNKSFTIDSHNKYSDRAPNREREILRNLMNDREALKDYYQQRETLQKYRDAQNSYDNALKKIEEIEKKIAELETLSKAKTIIRKTRKYHARIETYYENLQKADEKMFTYEAEGLRKVIDAEMKRLQEEGRKKLREERKARVEKARYAAERASITTLAKDSLKLLNSNAKHKYVPDGLKKPLVEFFQMFEFLKPKKDGGFTKESEALNEKIKNINSIDTENLQELLKKFREIVERNKSNDGAEFVFDINDSVIEGLTEDFNRLTAWKKMFESTPKKNIFEMDLSTLRALKHAFRTINKIIRNSNKLIASGMDISDTAGDTIETTSQLKAKNRTVATQIRKAYFSLVDPVRYFERLGKGAQSIFKELQKADSRRAFLIERVRVFVQNEIGIQNIEKWEKETHTIENVTVTKDDGNLSRETITVTTTQLMSLWCHWKREQSKKHLSIEDENGGSKTAGGGVFRQKLASGAYEYSDIIHYTQELANKMTSVLTQEQKDAADKLQSYMSNELAELGNMVTFKRFGIFGFNEKNYIPIVTEKSNGINEDGDRKRGDLLSIINKSFTKETSENAKSTVYIDGLFDVFANHASEMIDYNAFAIPLIDAVRWLNFSETIGDTRQIKRSVSKSIETAFGSEGVLYIRQLIKDINGSSSRPTGGIGAQKFVLRNTKIALVGGKMKQVFLQPTSIFRATEILDNSDIWKAMGIILKTKGAETNVKKAIEKARKWSGPALWKGLGYIDTNFGSVNFADKIKESDEVFLKKIGNSIKNKDAKKAYNALVDAGLKPMEIGDEIGWAVLWQACEYDVLKRQKSLVPKSDSFYRAVAERFDEVVYKTQVSDSVLSKPGVLRSTNSLTLMTASFMGEPIKCLNGVIAAYSTYADDAQRLGKKAALIRNRGTLTRAASVYAYSAFVAALVNTVAEHIGDDEEDIFNYKLFLKRAWSELGEEINPFLKIPFVKEIWDMFSGYDPSRLDLEAFSETEQAVTAIYNLLRDKGNYTKWGTILQVLEAASLLGGIPVQNIVKDIKDIWNATIGEVFEEAEWKEKKK